MSSKNDNWKKHISHKLHPYLYLVDEKYTTLTEDDKLIRKSILAEKKDYDNNKMIVNNKIQYFCTKRNIRIFNYFKVERDLIFEFNFI